MSKRWSTLWRADGIRYATRGSSPTIFAIFYLDRKEYARSTGVEAKGRYRRRDVEAVGRGLRKEARRNHRGPVKGEPTLEFWAERYGKSMVDMRRNEKHRKTQLDRWEFMIDHLGKSTTLGQITARSIETLVVAVREKNLDAGGDFVRNQTIEHYLKILRRAYRDAEQEGYDYRVPRFPDLIPDDPDDDQAGRWVEPADVYAVAWRLYMIAHERYRAMGPKKRAVVRCADLILFTLEAGLRREESERLEGDWITARGAELPRRGTKTKQARLVPLTDLARLIVEHRIERFGGPLVFGKIEHKKILAIACGEADVEPFHLRDIRHTCATLAARLPGMHISPLQAWFGWRNPLTAQRYLHAPEDLLVQFGDKMSRQLRPDTGAARVAEAAKMLELRENLVRAEGIEPTTRGLRVRHQRTGASEIEGLSVPRVPSVHEVDGRSTLRPDKRPAYVAPAIAWERDVFELGAGVA